MEYQVHQLCQDGCIDPALLSLRTPHFENRELQLCEEPSLYPSIPAVDSSTHWQGEEADFETSVSDDAEDLPGFSTSQEWQCSDFGSELDSQLWQIPQESRSVRGSLSPTKMPSSLATITPDHSGNLMQLSLANCHIHQNLSASNNLQTSCSTPDQMKQQKKLPGRTKKKPEDLLRNQRRRLKPERCSQCGKGHADGRDLDRHMVSNHREHAARIGLDVSKVKCSICGLKFDKIRHDRLVKHRKKIHKLFI